MVVVQLCFSLGLQCATSFQWQFFSRYAIRDFLRYYFPLESSGFIRAIAEKMFSLEVVIFQWGNLTTVNGCVIFSGNLNTTLHYLANNIKTNKKIFETKNRIQAIKNS